MTSLLDRDHARRLALALLCAMGMLILPALLDRALSAAAPPPDPLAPAARTGLNQDWYIRRGYADGSFAPPTDWNNTPDWNNPFADPRFQNPLTTALGHRVCLPLIRGSGGPAMVEARALWVTRWDYHTVTDVQALVESAAGAGFNSLLFQVRGTADAAYAPGLEPWAARLSGGVLGRDPGWDPLLTAVETAHARGLEVHAYVNVYPVWVGATAPPTDTQPQHLFWTLTQRHGDDWRPVDRSGVTMTLTDAAYLWATPALTDVVDRVISVTADIVSRYAVDGVHLDLVRYADRRYSHDPFSNAGYASALTADPTLTRAEWQRQQVTRLVERAYREVISPRPGLRLSAAVWPVYQDRWAWGYSEGYGDYYQDSRRWMLSGTVDAIMPMLYPADVFSSPDVLTATQFSVLVSDFLAHDGGRHVFPGISAQYPDFDAVAERIAIARRLGAPGHAIFSARWVALNDYWDEFAAGPYAQPATMPSVTWRP